MAESRLRSMNSDKSQELLDRVALSVFCDMGVISQQQFNDAVNSGVEAQIQLLNSIKNPSGNQADEFSDRFVEKIVEVDNQYDTNDALFSHVPPATLAKAYNATKKRLQEKNLSDEQRDHLESRLAKITDRMDLLTNNFATNSGFYFADPTNIADVYSGYKEMFDAREPDLEEKEEDDEDLKQYKSQLRSQIASNRQALDGYIQEYDKVNGISSVEEKEDEVETIEKNYDAAAEAADKWRPGEETLQTASKYRFLDADGNVKPQFINEEGDLTQDYQKGYEVNPTGELRGIIDLTRHDYALQHVKDDPVSGKSEEEINSELDNGVLYKLFELDTADKIAKGAIEDPERFTDPAHFNEFVNNLNANGGEISQQGYEIALDAQVNKTAGFAGRLKQKLGKFGEKAGNFFGKIFNPIRKIDKRRDDRIQGPVKTKREKRIEFFVRMLKGFGCAFLVSALITTVATAAAATAGLSLTASLATVGTLAAIVMTAIQIQKWRKAQREAGKDYDIKALLKDKRMLATIGTTGIAAIALICGATGLTAAAATLGYGALALGAGNNSISTYKDAKAHGMKTGEAIAWALGNAAAVIAGGFAGRATANSLISSYNQSHPDNRIFQKEEHHTEYRHDTRETQETVYKQETLDNAERITKMWYKDDPDLLQQRVDMINDYNSTHGTNIDPYRAIMMHADAGGMTADNMLLHNQYGPDIHSGGQHTVFGPRWAGEHGFSMNEVHAMQHMFDGGQVSDAGIQAAMKADHFVSPSNEVGHVTNYPFQNDHVLPSNAVDANGNPIYTTYNDGVNPYTTVTHIEDIITPTDVSTLTPVNTPMVGTFGNYFSKMRAKLKDRAGSKADQIIPDENDDKGPKKNDGWAQGNTGAIDYPDDWDAEDVPPHVPDENDDKGPKKNDGWAQGNTGAIDYPDDFEPDAPKGPEEWIIDIPEEEQEPPVEPVPPIIEIPEEETKDNGNNGPDNEPIDIPEEEQEPKKKQNDGWAQGNTGASDLLELYPDLWEEKQEEKQEKHTDAPKYLRITRADAQDITVKEKYLAKAQADWQNPKIQGKARDKLGEKITTLQRDLNHRLNEIGNPDKETLDDAMYWAFRKEDLENAQKDLAKEEQFKPAGKNKYEIKEHEQRLADLHKRIDEYSAEIPDDSMFYDPVAVQYDKEKHKKVPVKKVEKPKTTKTPEKKVEEPKSMAEQLAEAQARVEALEKRNEKLKQDKEKLKLDLIEARQRVPIKGKKELRNLIKKHTRVA